MTDFWCRCCRRRTEEIDSYGKPEGWYRITKAGSAPAEQGRRHLAGLVLLDRLPDAHRHDRDRRL
jgi:hypothetical protein